ncbi:hypothetical protein [Hugenholtzia roseola]|uniref:hypothetical protein n=1 Tax=Hugenholtzia roseola TaxID=1002 RepID=UPI00040DA445|nr:hypothetical protein [Hugenholtzia roseola]
MESEGKKVLDILLEKQAFLREEWAKTNHALTKFELEKNLEDLEKQIDDYRTRHQSFKSVKLLLISTDSATIEAQLQQQPEAAEIKARYGALVSDWIVYQTAEGRGISFAELITDFEKKSNISLEIYVIEVANKKILASLEDSKSEFIAIIDCLALALLPTYERVCSRFDARKVGGCLIPICSNFSEALQKRLREARNQTFELLGEEVAENFELSLGHIELELPTAQDFYRRLSNIIFGFGLIKEKAHIAFTNDAAKVLQNANINKKQLGI